MNKFIEKVIAITISIMLFISVNSFAAVYPERKHERKFISMAIDLDNIIEYDLIEMRNREVVKQAIKLDCVEQKEYEPSHEELNSLSLIDLYHIDPDYLKRRMSYMKVRELRKEVKLAIKHFSSIYNMDEYLIMAIVKKESYFNPRARSYKNAKGLMQLMPGTAIEMGVKDVFNPFQNLEGGIKYFKLMLAKFNGDESLALAAYNAGPYNVIKHKGIPPFAETQDYVKTILEIRKDYNDTYQGTV
jgi:transglycosylase-like protein with SLT domain